MSIEIVEFLGGPWDGDRRAVAGSATTVTVRDPDAKPTGTLFGKPVIEVKGFYRRSGPGEFRWTTT